MRDTDDETFTDKIGGGVMRKLAFLAVLLVMCAGCSMFPIKKHLVIEGQNISTPYGKGDKIKITRDVCFGAKCDAPVVDTTVK